jgi:hypothetical protein
MAVGNEDAKVDAMDTSGNAAILEIKDVTKYFGAVAALKSMQLSVMPGAACIRSSAKTVPENRR